MKYEPAGVWVGVDGNVDVKGSPPGSGGMFGRVEGIGSEPGNVTAELKT